ncbi:hypothetical protein BXZ70DRAFT_224441 [Cristinia sonorae]|uniref:BTB domain-containing protein n=1 Tax=Cristinia sonorae TaxID=1940300 RepID=A0A8K0ULQ6_9AGAR|nr:hypothetical protein BXZ70DRAFT_224441 [Cristinia sonorae]
MESFFSEGEDSFETCLGSPVLRQHEKLWLKDGNVVLMVNKDMLFKVHRSILSVHSAVFKDMFAMPQPAYPDEEDMYDGCPLVRLSDAPEDMGIFLDIFYNGIPYLQSRTEATWTIVRVLLLLGSKYAADRLYDEGVRQLERRYPPTIRALHAVQPGKECMDFKFEDCISIANVTRTLRLDRFYYNALYDCCQLDTKDLLSGVERSPGVYEMLDEEDLIRCVDGRGRLQRVYFAMMGDAFKATPDNRDESRLCGRLIDLFRSEKIETSVPNDYTGKYDPLRVHVSNKWFQTGCKRLCGRCAAFYVQRDEARMQEVLDNLKEYFDLEEPNTDYAVRRLFGVESPFMLVPRSGLV